MSGLRSTTAACWVVSVMPKGSKYDYTTYIDPKVGTWEVYHTVARTLGDGPYLKDQMIHSTWAKYHILRQPEYGVWVLSKSWRHWQRDSNGDPK